MMEMMEVKKAELVKEMEELKVEYRNYSGADGEIGRAFIYRQLDKISAKIELLDEMMAERESIKMREIMEKLEIASERFKEMEYRRERFLEDYEDNGNQLSLELAIDEQRQMDELTEAILKAKANL